MRKFQNNGDRRYLVLTDALKEVRIKRDVLKKLADLNVNANIPLFDQKYVRALMILCVGKSKLKRRDFHKNTIEFIRSKLI